MTMEEALQRFACAHVLLQAKQLLSRCQAGVLCRRGLLLCLLQTPGRGGSLTSQRQSDQYGDACVAACIVQMLLPASPALP